MSKRQSRLDSWSETSEIGEGDGNIDRILPFTLAIAGSLGILPFAVLRFSTGEYLLAVFDSVTIFGMLLLGLFVYKTRQVRLTCIALSLVCTAGVLISVYMIGPDQIVWAYPAIMAIFYLLRPVEAVALALAMIYSLLPVVLRSEDDFQTAAIIVTLLVMGTLAYAFATVTSRQRVMLKRLASRDPLTGAGNRRALDAKLDEIVAGFNRNATPSSLVILDLDHFKAVNDNHGHAKGDEILKRITEIVNLRIRVTDSLYRIGGEEFVVVVEHLGADKALNLAEQLRTLVEANELVPDQSVTISLGVAEIGPGETTQDWLSRADGALYKAKRMGRNTTATARPLWDAAPTLLSK